MFRAGSFLTKTSRFSRGKTVKLVKRYLSKIANTNIEAETRTSSDNDWCMAKCDDENGTASASTYWMPDRRTGIYVPKGHEGVIEDVPENAATFKETYWLRSVEGVDTPEPDNY